MGAYSAAILADSPFLYHRLGETSGTALADSSGGGHGATVSATMPPGGVASLLPGDPADGAIAFDRTGVAGPVLANGTLGYDSGALSVEFWVKPIDLTSSGTKCVAVSNNLGTGSGWYVWYFPSTGLWNFTNTGVADANFTAAAVAGVAQHIVFTTAAYVDISLYVNGSLSQTFTGISPRNPTGGTGLVLNAFNDGTLNGRMVLDEVAVYQSVLSAGRIAAHYAAAFDTGAPRQVAGWVTRSGGY